jgi:signal transduction histidine kinase
MIPLVSISILIVSYVGLQNFATTIQAQLINELKVMASYTMDNLSYQMFERVADIQFLSTSDILVNPNLTQSEKIDYLRSMERSFKSYSSISLYDKEGIKIGDTRNILLGLNESEKTFFKEAIKGKMYYDPIPTLSESLNQYVLHFAAPLYNESNDIEGVVVTRQPLNKINDIFKQIDLLDKPIDSVGSNLKLDLISDNGTVIYSNHDRRSILQIIPAFQELISISDQQNNRSILNPDSAETRIYNEEIIVSVPQGTGHLDYTGSNWFLLLRENADIVFGNLEKTVNQFLLVSGIILIVSIILILFISRNISLPLSKLIKKGIEIGKGNYNSMIDIKSSDEVGELASNFESMRQNVNHVHQTLNKRVIERTLELEKANEELRLNEEYLEEVNKELVSVGKAKEEFMSMVSHELKTPLVPARGYVELLLKQQKTGKLNEKQKKYANTVYRNLIKLEGLVSDVLDGYKIEMGKFRIQKNLVNVRDLISSVVSDLPSLIGEKQITVQIDSKLGEETTIMCDQKRIEQVFGNLIKNSIDFVPESTGKIIITAELIQEETMVQFSIEDNGSGIPDDKMDKLFHKFYQVDTSLIRKHGGSGLGLAISKGIVEAHGGKIWLDKEYRHGAAIRFTIPF